MPDLNISLEKAMAQLLEDYGDTIRVEVEEVIVDVGNETGRYLRANSPKRTGDYAKGWRGKKLTNTFYGSQLIIYNETDWQLTHLLNNGHANRDGGRTAGDHHIDNAEKFANELLVRKVEERLKQ